MARLIKLSDGTQEELDEVAARDAILAGTHSLGEAQGLNIRDTSTDEVRFFDDPETIKEVLSSDAYQIESRYQKDVREKTKELVDQTSGFSEFVKNAGDELLMGAPDLYRDLSLTEITKDESLSDEERYRAAVELEALQKKDAAYSTARTAGGTLGVLGNFIGSLGVGLAVRGGTKLAAKTAGDAAIRAARTSAMEMSRKIATGGLKLAAEGAAWSSPRSIAALAAGDEETALAELTTGAILNTAIGGAIKGASAAGRAVKKSETEFQSKVLELAEKDLAEVEAASARDSLRQDIVGERRLVFSQIENLTAKIDGLKKEKLLGNLAATDETIANLENQRQAALAKQADLDTKYQTLDAEASEGIDYIKVLDDAEFPAEARAAFERRAVSKDLGETVAESVAKRESQLREATDYYKSIGIADKDKTLAEKFYTVEHKMQEWLAKRTEVLQKADAIENSVTPTALEAKKLISNSIDEITKSPEVKKKILSTFDEYFPEAAKPKGMTRGEVRAAILKNETNPGLQQVLEKGGIEAYEAAYKKFYKGTKPREQIRSWVAAERNQGSSPTGKVSWTKLSEFMTDMQSQMRGNDEGMSAITNSRKWINERVDSILAQAADRATNPNELADATSSISSLAALNREYSLLVPAQMAYSKLLVKEGKQITDTKKLARILAGKAGKNKEVIAGIEKKIDRYEEMQKSLADRLDSFGATLTQKELRDEARRLNLLLARNANGGAIISRELEGVQKAIAGAKTKAESEILGRKAKVLEEELNVARSTDPEELVRFGNVYRDALTRKALKLEMGDPFSEIIKGSGKITKIARDIGTALSALGLVGGTALGYSPIFTLIAGLATVGGLAAGPGKSITGAAIKKLGRASQLAEDIGAGRVISARIGQAMEPDYSDKIGVNPDQYIDQGMAGVAAAMPNNTQALIKAAEINEAAVSMADPLATPMKREVKNKELASVFDPEKFAERAAAGLVTDREVAEVERLYPAFMRQFRNKILFASSKTYSVEQRKKLSKIFRSNMMPNIQVMGAQANFAQQDQQPQATGGASNKPRLRSVDEVAAPFSGLQDAR